jgi:hypothetical protein
MSLRRFLRAGVAAALLATVTVVAGPVASAQTGSATGIVHDVSGSPVEGATVYVMEKEPGSQPYVATTAADGTYTVTDIYAGMYGVIALPPSGSSEATSAMAMVQVTSGGSASVSTLTLTTAGVSGTVTSDIAGGPVANSVVIFMEMTQQGPGGDEFVTFTDANGNYKLGAMSGMFMAFAYDPTTASMTAPAQLQLTGAVVTQDFVFTVPNITGTVLAPGGAPYVNAFVIALNCDSDMYEAMDFCMVTGEGGFGASDDTGAFSMSVPNAGVYQLQVEPEHGDTTAAMHEQIFSLATAGEEKVFSIQLLAPNVTGKVTHPTTGAGVGDLWVMAMQLNQQGFFDGTGAMANGPTGDNGDFAFALATAGNYKFQVEIPWFNASLAGLMGIQETVAITGEAQTVNLALQVPNFTASFMKDATTAIQWGWINVCQAPGTNWGQHCMSVTDSGGTQIQANISETGAINLNLHPYMSGSEVFSGSWKLWLYPDEYQNAGTAKTGITVTMNADNTAVTEVLGHTGSAITAESDGSYIVTAAEPNLNGTVIDPTTSLALSLSGHDRGHLCAEESTARTWDCTSVGTTGTFGIALDDGTYTVRVEPPHGSTTMSAVSFTATIASGVATASGSAATQSAAGAAISVTLGTPNLIGVMQKSGEAAGDGHLGVQSPQDENGDGVADWWNWTSGHHISSSGAFATEVAEGTYKITAEPGWNLSGASPVDGYIDVASDGTVTCDTDYGPGGCTMSSGSVVMSWGTPNFQAVIYNPTNEAGEIDGGLDVERWYQSDGSLATSLENAQWTRWTGWGNGGTTGLVELTLANGVYNVRTRPGWGTADLAGASFTVVVTSGTVDSCQTTASTPANCSTNSGAYVLPLSTPNFSGMVVKGDYSTAAPWSHISVMQWQDSDDDGDIQTDQCCDHPEWIGGSNARPVTVNNQTVAKFGMSLADGSYELDVHPSWEDTTSIRRKLNLTVASGSVTACTPVLACASDGQGGYTLALNTSNVSGSLTDSDGAAVQYSFVDVMVDDDGQSNTGENGYESFVTWADVNELGAFSLYLDAGQAGAARNYQLAAFPSWSDTTHQRTLVTVEVSGDPAAVTNCTKVTSGDCITAGNLTIQLSKGNYFGTIKSSTGDNLSNALVMLLDGSGAVITDSLTNSNGVFYLNISDGDISDNSCTSNNVCDLKVQPASLAIGSAVDQDTTFQLGTDITTGQTAKDLGSKTLTVAS